MELAQELIDAVLTEYWHTHYIDKKTTLCSLCCNTGIIDSTSAVSPIGIQAGKLNFCICPNGRAMRRTIHRD